MLIFIYCLFFACQDRLDLEQVIIFSRHNIRVPLSENLGSYTNKYVPKWPKDSGMLTDKGALLEEYMGSYLSTWMSNNKLLPKICPDGKNIVIYANNQQRTVATAQAFTHSAFPNCKIDVVLKNNNKNRDNTFNPVIRNSTESFKRTVMKEIEQMLDNNSLEDAYEELDSIIDLNTSKICAKEGFCDLINDKNVITYEPNEELQLNGPLHIANGVVDNFIMSYYDGCPLEDIGWGQIITPTQWELLTKISKAYLNVRFNVPSAVDDMARPLLKYMKTLFLNQKVKFALLVGHDANLNCITNSLGFVAFELKEQYEPFPIGGKLVFQRWKDAIGNEYLKVEYVYMSWDQIRDGAVISTQNPPLRQILEIKGCAINEKDLCPWKDFLKIMGKY